MLTTEERVKPVAALADRPVHAKFHVHLRRLPVDGLGADSTDVDFEMLSP